MRFSFISLARKIVIDFGVNCFSLCPGFRVTVMLMLLMSLNFSWVTNYLTLGGVGM